MKKIIKQLISNPLFSGSAIMIIGSNSANFLNLVYHFVVGRMLGPSLYGELASLISLIGLLSIVPSSISLVVIKYVSSAKSDEDIVNLISWLKSKIIRVSILFFIIILIFSPLISSFLHINKIIYLILIAVSFLFSLQSLFYRSILQGLLKFKEMVFSILVENSVKLIVSIFLIFLGLRVGGAMLAFVIAAFLGWYVTYFNLRSHSLNNPKTPSDIKSMAIFTIPVLIQSISVTSLYSSDIILVKHFFSSHDAGIYASLSTLGKIIFFGTSPIAAVMFPLVSKKKTSGENYKKIYIYSFIATLALASIVLFIYLLVPQMAIKLLYGSAYLEASNLLIWFGIFISLFSLSSLIINFSLSLGKIKAVFLPVIAAILQFLAIWFYHQNLFQVILISTIISALLLIALLIYSSYGSRVSFSNRSGV